jgi:hypothetical protein
MTYLIEIDNNSRSYLERGYENIQKAKTHGKDRLFAFIPTSAVRR